MSWVVILFIILIVLLYNISFALISRRRYLRCRHQFIVEKTQADFAEARYQLVLGLFKKEIDPNNRQFQLLYFLNTGMMGNPDKYREMNRVLRGFITELTDDGKVTNEPVKEDLGEHFKKSQELTAKALGNVIVDYSWKWKLLYRVIKGVIKDFEPKLFLAIPFISREIKEQVQIEINSRKARKAIENKYSNFENAPLSLA